MSLTIREVSPESGTGYSASPLISSNKKEPSNYKTLITGIVIFVLLAGVVVLAAFVLTAVLDNSSVYRDDVNRESKGSGFRDGGATGRRAFMAPLPPVLVIGNSKNAPSSSVAADRAAANLLNSSLDWNYYPCSNFYEFVCKKFHGILPDVLTTSQYNFILGTKSMLRDIEVPERRQRAVDRAAGLYQACTRLGSSVTNTEVPALKSFLRKVGLDITNIRNDPKFDYADKFARLSLEYGFPIYVKFGYFRRPHLPNKILDLQVHQLDEQWLEEQHQKHNHASLLQIYYSYIRLYDPGLSGFEIGERIIKSEIIMRRKIQSIRQSEKIWSTFIDELGSFTRGYVSLDHWKEVILRYTGGLFSSTDTLVLWDNATEIVNMLMDPHRMEQTDSRLLMGWSLLHRLLPLAHGQAMIDLASSRTKLPDPVDVFCLETVHGVISLPITNLYLKKLVPRSALDEARQVVASLRNTLVEKIKNTDWIKDNVWCLMFGKGMDMRLVTGFPEEFDTENRVEQFYSRFPSTRPSEFFNKYLEFHRILTSRIHTENVTENFTAGNANAFYDGTRNTLTILPALLQPPVFIHQAPAAINYGGLGQAVAHEMMHGFDPDGIAYSYRFKKHDFHDEDTMEEYRKRLLCLRSSYQKAEGESRARTLDDHIDAEGFADFAGILLAYEAYQSLPDRQRARSVPFVPLNEDQLFFVFHCLKWCSTVGGRRRDPNSPYWHSRSRCIVPLQNMPEFANAFSCSPGDLMNPAERCAFW